MIFFKPSNPRLALGKRGEKAAWDYLRRERFTLLEKNVRSRLGEIDIVAEKKGRLYFIEVKTRSGLEFGAPAESVTREKQRRLGRLAAAYLQRKRKTDVSVSFGVISVLWRAAQKPQIRLIEDAFILE